VERIKSIQSWFRTLLSAIGAAVAIYLNEIENRLNQGVKIAFILIALILFFKITEDILQHLIDKFRWVRRLLFGHSFIEGHWIEAVYDKSSKNLLLGAYVVFKYEHGEISLSGWSVDEQGKSQDHFRSVATFHKDDTLLYIYVVDSLLNNQSENSGFGEYHFLSESDSPPLTYTGKFYYPVSNVPILVEGRKITDTHLIALLRNPDQRRQALMKYVKESDHFEAYRGIIHKQLQDKA
jgi:hypothetical protein